VKKNFSEAREELSRIVLHQRNKLGINRESHAKLAKVPLWVVHFIREGVTRKKEYLKPRKYQIKRAMTPLKFKRKMRVYVHKELINPFYD
jgi:hypothetical protein